MNRNRVAVTILRVAAGVPRLATVVADRVVESMRDDGRIDPDEAQRIAVEASEEFGDLKVKVRGVDVVDEKAQKHLARFVGRVVARTVGAFKDADSDSVE